MTAIERRNTSSPWRLVMIGFAALAVSFSVRAVLGLAMPVIEKELGWSRAFLSGVGALALLLMACAAPFAGRFIDRSGPRLLMTGGMIAIAAGAAAIAVARSPLVFALAFGVVAAIGFTAVATHVVAAAIAKNFEKGQGLATGIGTSGATAGQLLVVPAVAILMQTMSWRYGFAALAIVALMLAIVAALWLPRPQRRAAGNIAQAYEPMTVGIRKLIRVPTFHILFWSFLLCGFTTTGVIETHLLPYASFCGFPPLPSATAYGILSAVNLAGMIFAGYLSDRVHRPSLLTAIYIVRAASFVLLLYVAPDIRLLYLFVVLFGLVDYATMPVTAGLAASHLGIDRIGLAMGLISGGHALGGAAGALAGGLLFDQMGGYAPLWISSVGVSLLAGVMAFLLRDQPATPQILNDKEPAL